MSKVEHKKGPHTVLVCSVCKQPLDMAIKGRHKTLGVFVPVWGPRPCRNPECPENARETKHEAPENH